MGDLITVVSFRDIVEAEIVKGRLEAHEIECHLKDYNIVSSQPFYSNAVGGVKLQVWEEDVERALEIIREAAPESLHQEVPEPDMAYKTEKFLTKFLDPVFNKPGVGKKIALVTVVIIIAFGIAGAFLSVPNTTDKLSSGYWMVSEIIFNDSALTPHSLVFFGESGCGVETIKFKEDGSCNLPGISTYPAKGKWKLKGTVLELKSDSLQEIYNGDFAVQFFNDNNNLFLKSRTTSINCALCKVR